MKLFFLYLLFTVAAFSQVTSVRFDGHELRLVANREETAAGITTYRSKSADVDGAIYEVGVVRLRNWPGEWTSLRESLLGAVTKKAVPLDAIIRGEPKDAFVVVDFGYVRPDGVTFEYVILDHSLSEKRDLVTFDVRIRFPLARKDLVTRIRKDREALVSEFRQLIRDLRKPDERDALGSPAVK